MPVLSSRSRCARSLLALGVATVLVPGIANASYVDPLTGSVILQVLAAGALSLVFTMKRSMRWLGSRWSALRETLRRR